MSLRRVLVVDDNEENLAAGVLGFECSSILKALDAETAQGVISQGRRDLILMNIALPGMDGLSPTRKPKSHPMTRYLVNLGLTASAMEGDEIRAFDAGCGGYVTETRNLPLAVARLPRQAGNGSSETTRERSS